MGFKIKDQRSYLQRVNPGLFEEITRLIEEKVIDIGVNLGIASAKERFAVEELRKDMRQILRNQRDLFQRLKMTETTEDPSPYLRFTSSDLELPDKR